MISHNVITGRKKMTLAALLACSLLIAPAFAQSNAAPVSSVDANAAAPARPAPNSSFYASHRELSTRAAAYYGLIWGVDSLSVKVAESGQIVRFSYRVLDANKAATLNDKKTQPALIAPKAGVQLVVPSLEQVGQLRQSSTPEAGKSYWMAFSNKGRLVKPGDLVTVVIGKFRAEGLLVD